VQRREKPPVCRHVVAHARPPRSACHAEGRGFESLQPLLTRPAFAGLFRVRSRLVRLRRVGLTPDSPRTDRRPFQRKPPVCRPILVRPNPSPSARLQKVGCSPAAAVTPTRTAAARSSGQRPPARYRRSRHLGASPVSVRKPRGQPRPAPRQPPASHGTQRRELLRRRRPTQLRGPHNEDLVSPESHGGHRRGCGFPSATRRSARTTWAGLLVGRVGGRLAGPLGLDGQRHRSASRPLIEPCVRFSRTRLTDIVHRRQTHAWT
jgi:hypothetical protein